ncbi:hypothetical protein ACTXJ2_01650 [Psychrobacter alimentarius]|uniref:hypothetical protein n=1 Tax=Psychrobacter TaxID=497 RepID=UPI000BAAEE4C|nr:hypothetical protein [Psychrobacter sp. JB193]PAT63024.1 hypothetical protein CIK80_10715 [Psychrobacter sp. JB193]
MSNTNTNTNNDSSDIDKAAAQADSQKIAENLEETKEVNKPESLSEEEQTPFIEDDLRTDK